MENLKIEYVPIEELKPYERNAKLHPDEQVEHIANSIREFGFCKPLVVDKDNVLVIGHGRLLAAQKMGLDSLPCVRADGLTDEQIKALRIVDNKTNESEWDFDLLAEELPYIDLSAFDFDFGFQVNEQINGVSYIQELLEDKECMTNKKSLERDEFSISFCFPKEYEETIKSKIKEKTKEFYQQEIMKIMGVI